MGCNAQAAPVDWVLGRLLLFCDSAKAFNIELVPSMVEHPTRTYDCMLERKPKFMQHGWDESWHAASYRVNRFGRGSVSSNTPSAQTWVSQTIGIGRLQEPIIEDSATCSTATSS